jgi:protein-S-isoprenylcysteine O-methyltransferase Ste14
MKTILHFRPPRIALSLLIISVVLWHLSPDKTLLHIPYKFIGSVSVIGGFIIMMWAWSSFKKGRTAVCHTGTPTLLVTHGVYKMTRNPMYLGMLLMLAGAGFFMGDVPAFFAPVAFLGIIDKVFIPYEEAKLSGSFGDAYSDYMKRTRRWV